MTTKKITFDIESREDEEDRTTISINGIGEVVLIETFPEYEFLEDIGEDGLEELNVEEGDLIGKIEHLEIEDEYKGQGYAKILMNKAIELAKEKGLMPLYLNASPMGSKRYGLDVDDLTGFYESLGFEVFLRQGGNNLMILKDTYKTGGETKNKIMAKQIKIQFEDNYADGGVTYSEWSKDNVWQEQFNDWMEDGNVSKNADGTYSTQDAQYTNSLKGMSALKRYFYNEFIKGQYDSYAGGGGVEKKEEWYIRSKESPLDDYKLWGISPLVVKIINSKGEKGFFGFYKLLGFSEKAFGNLTYWLVPFGVFRVVDEEKSIATIDFIQKEEDVWKFDPHWMPKYAWIKADEIKFDEWNFTKDQLEKYIIKNDTETDKVINDNILKFQNSFEDGGITDNNHLIAKAIEFVTGYAVDTDTIQEKENNYSFRYKGRNVYSSLNSKLVNDTIRMHRKSLEGRYAKGGSVGKGYNVFNYTDNIYATDEVFKTEKLANDFIKEFRNRFSKQGYYRDNQMNKIAIEDIDLLAIPSDFNPFGKYEDGGEMQEEKFRYKDFYQSQGGIKFKTEEEAERFIKTTKPFVRKQLREGNLVLVFNGKEYFIAEKIKINDEYADGGEVIVDGLTKQDFIDAYLKRAENVIENLKQKGQYDSEDFDLLGEVDSDGGFTEIEDVGFWLDWANTKGDYDALTEFISVYDFSDLDHYTFNTLAHLYFGKPMKIDLNIISGGDSEYDYNTELQKIKLLLNKIDFDKIQGEINYEEIENNTNLKFYKDGTLVMSLNGDWNEESEELDTIIDIDGETAELNYHPLDSMGGVNMEQLEKNINEALRELNTYSAVVSIEGYEEYAEDVEGLENAKALMQDIKGNTRFQVLKGSSVGIGKRVDDSRVVEEFARGGETKTPKKYIVKGYVYDGGEIWKETFDNIDEAYELAYLIQNGWTDDGTYRLITIYDEKGKKVATISDDKYFNELTEHKLFKKVYLGADTKKERQVENEKLKGYKFNLQIRIADGGATGIFEKTFDSIFEVMDKAHTYYEEDYYARINDESLDYWEDKYYEIELSRNYIKGKYGWSFLKENNYWIAKDDYDNNHIVRIVNGKPTSDSSITKGALKQILELEAQKKYSEKPKHNKSLSDMKKIWDGLSDNYKERENIVFLIGYSGGQLREVVPYKFNDFNKSFQIQIMNAYFGQTEEQKQKIINKNRKEHEALVKNYPSLKNLYGKKYADGGETMYRKFYAVSFWLKDGIDAQNWIKENGLTNYELEIEEGDEEINGNGYRVNVYNLGAGKYNTLTYLDSIVDTMIEEDKYASGGEIDTTDLITNPNLITNMKNGLVVKFSFDYVFGEKGTEYLFFKNGKFYYLKILYKNDKKYSEDKEIVSEQDVIDFYSLHYNSISGEFYNNKMATGGDVDFVEAQINDIVNWDNDEIASYLQIPVNEVANNRLEYIEEAQNSMLVNQVDGNYAKGGQAGKLKDYIIYSWKSKNDVVNDNYEITNEEEMTEKEVIELYQERMRRGYDFAVQIYEKGKNRKQIYSSKSYDDVIDSLYSDSEEEGNDSYDLKENILSKYGLNLEGNRVRTNFKSTAYEIANEYDGDVEQDADYYIVSFRNIYAKGGEAGFDSEGTSMVLYHEKNGNWLVPKGQVYLYLYDVENSGSKLGKEFDWVFYPLTAPIMAWQSGYIPPLKKIWTKKFQKDHKGSEHLLGVIKAYLIEEDGKKELFIDMMSVNPNKKKKGIMSYMIKELRESFNLSQDQVTFSDLTDEGKKFVEKKTYADGGETSGLITDEQVKDLSFKVKIKNVPLQKGVLLHEIITLEEFDLPDEENINFYPFHLIYGDSSLAIFDAFGVDEVAGLKRKDCEEFINNLKAQGKTEKDGSFMAGLTNYVGDKLFMFFNVSRLSYEGFANRVLPHEALHLSRSLISLYKNDWVRENLNTPKWWEDKRAVFVDMGDSNEEFFAETLERTTAIAMDGWYRVTGQKCVVEKNKTYADGGEITIRHEIKNGKKNYFLYDIKTGKKSGSYKSQTEANDKLKNLLQMKYALKLSSRKYADGGKIGKLKVLQKIVYESIKNKPSKSITTYNLPSDTRKILEELYYMDLLDRNYINGTQEAEYTLKYANGGDVPHEDKMFQLPLEMVVYVPSTQDVDKVISVDKMVTRVDEVKEYLASKFGGYTSADKLGGFVDSTGNLVNEDVVQVTAFATKEAYAQYKEELIHQLALWGKKWGQEAIGFEFEGDLMYVPQEL